MTVEPIAYIQNLYDALNEEFEPDDKVEIGHFLVQLKLIVHVIQEYRREASEQ